MSSPKRLVLFDIDGTLIETGGAGLASLRDGFFDAFPEMSEKPFPELDLGGATDGGVAMFLFDHFDLEDSHETRAHFYGHYIGRLKTRLVDFENQGKGRILEGVELLLSGLGETDTHELAVLTGNIQEGAWMKLRHYGLDPHFRYGAFGDDHHDRNELGSFALKRAADIGGMTFAPEDVVVIGDTVKDIACARALGAKVIAVATGSASREALEAASPDRLLNDFSDLSSTIEAIRDVFL